MQEAFVQMGLPCFVDLAEQAGMSTHWALVLAHISASERSMRSVIVNAMHPVVVAAVILDLLATHNSGCRGSKH